MLRLRKSKETLKNKPLSLVVAAASRRLVLAAASFLGARFVIRSRREKCGSSWWGGGDFCFFSFTCHLVYYGHLPLCVYG